MASAVVAPPVPATKFGVEVPKLNLALLQEPSDSGRRVKASSTRSSSVRGRKPPPADKPEGKMSKSAGTDVHVPLHNSFVLLSEDETPAVDSPGASSEFFYVPTKLSARDAELPLGLSLAVQQLREEDEKEDGRSVQRRSRKSKSRKSSKDSSSLSKSGSLVDELRKKGDEVQLLSVSPSAPLFYSSDLHDAPEFASETKTKQSIYDTEFWRRYGFVIVHLSMVLCQSCFAAVNVFGKYGLHYIHPMVLVILRNIGTLPFLMVSVGLLERNHIWRCITWTNFATFCAMGVFTMQISQAMYVYGLQLSTATNSATLHLAIPVWTCMVCIACRMERFSFIKVLGIACAVGGALVMVEVESFDFSGDTMTGNLLILGMTVLYSLYLVLCKPLVSNIPPLNLNMWIFITASMASVPIAMVYWRECWDAMHVSNGQVWMSVSLAVVVGTAIPYLIITWAIKQASPLVVAIYTPMELIATTMLAFLYLGEEPGLRQLAGALCILAGLAVTTYAQQTERKVEPTKDIEEAPSSCSDDDDDEATPLIARTA